MSSLTAARRAVEVPVLIVGAGPTGLISAIELLRRGVDVQLIDRLPVPHTTSKSFTLHARTLEMMEHIGIANRYLEDGIKCKGFKFNFDDSSEHPVLDFTKLPGRYPFILIYNQNETERVLRQHLQTTYDFAPEWGVQLTSLSQGKEGISATLKLPDGTTQEVRPRWVIGADGVRSRVRDSMGISYEGEDYQENILQMMDVGVTNFTDGDDWIHYFMAKEHFLLVTKLPGTNYRVLISDLGNAERSTLQETREAFQGYVDSFRDGARLSEPRWATKWKVWRRLTAKYRQGAVFLAGDAAHCHSPSGGSGMNACMQDAFNLAWKIAMVERGEAHPSLLDTYESERKPVAQQLLAGTHAMHEIIMGHGQGLADRIAKTQAPGWNEAAAELISGMSYNYRDQLGAYRDDTLPGVVPGDRVPDAQLDVRLRLFDVTRRPALTLVLAPKDEGEIQVAEALRREVSSRWPQVKTAFVLPAGHEVVQNDVYVDATGELAKKWGNADRGWASLIRPDNYVHLRSSLSNRDTIIDGLSKMLVGA